MRKAERLNDIVHHLRRMHQAVTAQTLAETLELNAVEPFKNIADFGVISTSD